MTSHGHDGHYGPEREHSVMETLLPEAVPGGEAPLMPGGLLEDTSDVHALPGPDASIRGRGPFRRAFRQFFRDRVAVVALCWVVLMAMVAIVSIWWTPHPPNEQFIADPFAGPSATTWLGADDLGRDVFSRLMVGTGVALLVAFIVVSVAVAIAVPLGLYAGYRGSYSDIFIMRILDAITAVPSIVLGLAIMGVLGPGMTNLGVVLIIILVPSYVRLVRAQSLKVSAEPYVAASRSVGSRTPWILLKRVLPGVIPALSVQVSLGLGATLTAEAAFSYLGLGVQSPNSSWGGVLSRAYRNILPDPGGIFPPIVAIAVTVLAFNLIGDGLRDALGTGIPRKSKKRSRTGVTTVVPPAVVTAVDRDREPSASAGSAPRLAVEDLCVEFHTETGVVQALDHVSLDVDRGEVLGIVGESGSGKTVTSMSIMRLLQSPPGIITKGSARFEGTDLFGLSLKEMRDVRGGGIGMVFQNPMMSLDPLYTIGNSLREAIQNHSSLSRSAANARAIELLSMVGIPSPAERLGDYPHSFSGGMRQRVMIAMALAGEPRLLIADEPTTALDVTIQAQILDLLKSLQVDLGMSVILVTHDLGVVAEICDRVAVMYAGQIVETASVESLYASPAHPYTAGLLGAVPSMTTGARRLRSLPGSVPQLHAMPTGCRFAPRCAYAIDACREASPSMRSVGDHEVRCIRANDLTLSETT